MGSSKRRGDTGHRHLRYRCLELSHFLRIRVISDPQTAARGSVPVAVTDSTSGVQVTESVAQCTADWHFSLFRQFRSFWAASAGATRNPASSRTRQCRRASTRRRNETNKILTSHPEFASLVPLRSTGDSALSVAAVRTSHMITSSQCSCCQNFTREKQEIDSNTMSQRTSSVP